MRWKDLAVLAVMNLRRKKTRTLLTAFSMAIGATCIIVLIGIGLGYNRAYQQSIEEMGSLTKIDVSPPTKEDARQALLNKKAVEAFRGIEGVEAVTPVVQVNPYLKAGKYFATIRLYGIEMNAAEAFHIVPLQGELPGKGTPVGPQIILTDDVAASFADPVKFDQAIDRSGEPLVDPLNTRLALTFDYGNISGAVRETEDGRAARKGENLRLTVTGMTANQNYTFSSSGFIELATLEKIIERNSEFFVSSDSQNTYPLVWVKVRETKDVQDISNLIRDAGFQTYSLNDMLESVKKQSRQIQGMLAAVGAVSLLVAAICIVNTMSMAITERTREIGVMKVLGSDLGNIRIMFLLEALLIGLIGGILGLGLSFILQYTLASLLAEMSLVILIPMWLAGGGVAFAALTSILAGFYPASRAMRISPMMAIREEV